MAHPESSIIRLPDAPLEPTHGGIIAWRYGGWGDWAERYFADGNHRELYNWAGDVMRMPAHRTLGTF
jgi:hypothetical protein